jgi:LysR family transcriptional regulator for metE and metH
MFMINLEVRHLKLVTAIADQGSVTGAANHLNLTQSALSHQLRDIEDKLGAALFQRASRKMLLTPAGERLLESARSVLEELGRAEEEIRNRAARTRRLLRISTECYTCYHWLPPSLKVLNGKHPNVQVRILADATRRPVQALLDGKLDLAITSTKVRNRKLIYKPLFRDEVVVIMRPDHPLARRPYLVARDFAGEHLIAYAVPKEELVLYQQVLVPAGVVPREFTQVELTEAIVEMVKAGIGVSTMARWAAAPQLKSGSLKAIRLTRAGFHRTWYAVMLRTKVMPDYIREFVKILSAGPTTLTADSGRG